MSEVAKQNPKFEVFIFSFNRARFLHNCIQSLQQHWPSVAITVVDDRSDDENTVALLGQLPEENVQVILAPAKSDDNRHGGLYNNMQLALDTAAERGSEYVLFLQDDMQLVRDIDKADVDYVQAFFNEYQRAAFLHPLFLKGARRRRDKAITYLSQSFPAYFRKTPKNRSPRGITYADCFIGYLPRLLQANWQFQGNEVSNAEQAETSFGEMGFMLHPFAMYLPEVPVYRGKKKTLGVRLAEVRGGEEPSTYLPLNQEQRQRLQQRDPNQQLPVAEDFLQTTRKAKKPFRYSQINAFPMLRVLHKIEQSLQTR